LLAAIILTVFAAPAFSHVVPPEKFDPAVEGYRRMMFLLNLNPVLWDKVRADAEMIAESIHAVDPALADDYRLKLSTSIDKLTNVEKYGDAIPGPKDRIDTARFVFEQSTRALAFLLNHELNRLKNPEAREGAERALDQARKYWAAFDHEVRYSDPDMHKMMGRCFLELATAMGNQGLMGQGGREMDTARMAEEAGEIGSYIDLCYSDFRATKGKRLSPLPWASNSFNPAATVPDKLPPGSNINKQRPRPRQILNLVARGVSETETPLVAFGDMAFDSPHIFGPRAVALGLSCNNCHNKSITNPNLIIPGLSNVAGGIDVTNNFFAPHADNGHFDPLDTPDLRGVRFTGPYGRNGRFASLREFTRNVIVNEFDGPEPDPIVLDGLVAYMNEFDFLPNPQLKPNGMLSEVASESAQRGEVLFHTPQATMNMMSCASCHIPSSNFTDGKRHDLGTVKGAEEHSIDRHLDTPTLLSSRFTAPYFHDGSQPTLTDVVRWFDRSFSLGYSDRDVADMTAYLEAIGDGTEPMETDPDIASPAEIEEQYFFMSSWEFLRDKKKPELADLVFRTVATEIRNEKWSLRYPEATEVAEALAKLADECLAANNAGNAALVDSKIIEFRDLYETNAELISGNLELPISAFGPGPSHDKGGQ